MKSRRPKSRAKCHGTSRPPKVTISKPLSVTAVAWKRHLEGDDASLKMVEVEFDYEFVEVRQWPRPAGDHEQQHPDYKSVRRSGNPIAAYPSLTIPPDLLEEFVTLGTSERIRRAVNELSDQKDQGAVKLKNGVLAELLGYGISPQRLWTFVLDFGPVVPRTMLLLPQEIARTHDHAIDLTAKRRRFKKAIELCRLTAKSLMKIQRVSVRPEWGPVPPLAPIAIAELIESLQQSAAHLETFLPDFKRAAHRPAKPVSSAFAAAWYALAMEHANSPLYQIGAQIFALVFGGSPNPKSFMVLCTRARAVTKD